MPMGRRRYRAGRAAHIREALVIKARRRRFGGWRSNPTPNKSVFPLVELKSPCEKTGVSKRQKVTSFLPALPGFKPKKNRQKIGFIF
jgi:hypothetical protein